MKNLEDKIHELRFALALVLVLLLYLSWLQAKDINRVERKMDMQWRIFRDGITQELGE